MSVTADRADIEPKKLDQLLGALLQDLGGAFAVPLVRMGESLGLYRKLQADGPLTPAALAEATGIGERYAREWLSAQAASNYVSYDAANGAFYLTPEQAAVFADESSPVYLAPAFECSAAYLENQPLIENAFRKGQGVGWGEQSMCLSCAVAKFFRPGYEHNLVQQWLPALEGVVERLERGIRVADVGCGHGISTMIMARAFPKSEFVGFDFHDESIAAATDHAKASKLSNVRFETALAKGFPGKYGFVTIFDCLHDMGDPAGAMKHVRQALDADGACMIVEPIAGDRLEDNLNPVGRLYYSASTMVCVPTSLAQEVGTALGAQAGEARLRQIIVEEGGFGSLRRAAETPFNMVLEARP
jgi:SAM-dependent methyltransferase